MNTVPDDKKPPFCPGGGGGHRAYLTDLCKCVRCGKAMCTGCKKSYRSRPHCKPCMKEAQREESRRV